jgi:3-deoxy-D-manno-octulosonic-acid transferase
MYELYSGLLALALLLSLPYWFVQWLRHGKYGASMGQRFGRPSSRLIDGFAGPSIWVHAVSVGEVMAVAGLIGELKRTFPQYRVVLSTTTATGQELAASRFGGDSVFYFPMDFNFAIRPYLRSLRPALVMLVETELWPNFLRLAHASGARIAVVNARISDRSLPRYRRWRRILRRVLGTIDIFLAQTEVDLQRLLSIGAPADRIQVTGNLKFDVAIPAVPPVVPRLRAAIQQAQAQPVVVCGSTVDGEETLLLEAFKNLREKFPRALLVLAPRRPERFEIVAQLLADAAIPFWRRSIWADTRLCGGVFLLDSIGELASIYALADLAFVGGSLVPRGGHNILEPAQHGVPILVGPHTENFRDIVRAFQANNAVRIVEPRELSSALTEMSSDETARQTMGRLAAETVRAHAGATQRTIMALQKLMRTSPPNTTINTPVSEKQSLGSRPQ